MNRLMRHVERAVRPVVATPRRKLHMREELLAHLQSIYDQQRPRAASDDEAVDAAIARFGPADELSRQLTASVPWYDPIQPWLDPIRHRKPFSYRTAALAVSTVHLVIVVLALSLMALTFKDIGLIEYFAVLLVNLAIMPPVFAAMIAMAAALYGVQHHPKSLRRALLYAVALAAYLLAVSLAILTLTDPGLHLSSIIWVVTASLAAPLILAPAAGYLGSDIRKSEQTLARLEPWERIDLPAD